MLILFALFLTLNASNSLSFATEDSIAKVIRKEAALVFIPTHHAPRARLQVVDHEKCAFRIHSSSHTLELPRTCSYLLARYRKGRTGLDVAFSRAAKEKFTFLVMHPRERSTLPK